MPSMTVFDIGDSPNEFTHGAVARFHVGEGTVDVWLENGVLMVLPVSGRFTIDGRGDGVRLTYNGGGQNRF